MNTIKAIAQEVRDYYLQRFSGEYNKQFSLISRLDQRTYSNRNQWNLLTDCDLGVGREWIGSNDIKRAISYPATKLYRHDLVIYRDNKPVKTFMCWPVHVCAEEEFVEEDIISFEPFHGYINQTEIEIHPFPWFYCNIVFFPCADNVKGIMDMWFYKWFFMQTKPEPFLKVIHRMDGPYMEQCGGESYLIDFGTAQPEAFCDFIYLICRSGVKRVLIH